MSVRGVGDAGGRTHALEATGLAFAPFFAGPAAIAACDSSVALRLRDERGGDVTGVGGESPERELDDSKSSVGSMASSGANDKGGASYSM